MTRRELGIDEVAARLRALGVRDGGVVERGRWVRIAYRENDHCCARFGLADGWLRERGLQAEGPVGHAQARLARARDVVAVARERLAEDPLVFLHPRGEGCAECDAARASVG